MKKKPNQIKPNQIRSVNDLFLREMSLTFCILKRVGVYLICISLLSLNKIWITFLLIVVLSLGLITWVNFSSLIIVSEFYKYKEKN